MRIIVLLIVVMLVGGCATMSETTTQTYETATFAGGCFWCMEPPFEQLDGVIDVVPGYTGGSIENPTYEQVSSGTSGHFEVVQITYDPKKIHYLELLRVFWQQIDPTDPYGQFADRGPQYRTAIFYHTDEQKMFAEQSKNSIATSYDKPIATMILQHMPFYAAEEYHQDYYKKQPQQYAAYKTASGREEYISQNAQKPASCSFRSYDKPTNLKETLTPLQYKVTQQNGTEQPFNNAYWDNTEEGIYVDIVTGEPLFSSKDKFDSGTGWPSFTKPITESAVIEKKDTSYGMVRIEVRSQYGNSHLGHVFNDGPNGSDRYCMNSASLRFIPKNDLIKEGYGEYLALFT